MFNLFAWILSLVLMTIAVFSNYPLQQPNTKHTNLEFALYESLSRVAWSIALCYIIFACINNYGGPVNWFLGHPVWQPLSRLSYAIYIVHISVITVTQTTLKTSPYFSELNAVRIFVEFDNFDCLFISFCITFLFSFAVSNVPWQFRIECFCGYYSIVVIWIAVYNNREIYIRSTKETTAK